MKFWAVLGSLFCREKKPPNCHKYATFGGGFFNFLWEKIAIDLSWNKSVIHRGPDSMVSGSVSGKAEVIFGTPFMI